MSNHPGVGTILETLNRLKSTVGELTSRADKLNDEFRLKVARETQQREAALEAVAAQLANETRGAETAFASARQQAEVRFEARKGRIGRAYQASKEQVLQGIDKRTGGRKYELQKGVLQAERDRDAALNQAATDLQEFKTQLATEQEALAQLEGKAQTAFRGYRKFLRGFFDAYNQADAQSTTDEQQLLVQLRDRLTKARKDLDRFCKFWLLRIFKTQPLWILIILAEIPLLLHQFGMNTDGAWKCGEAVLASLFVVFLSRFIAVRQAAALAAALARELAQARHLHDAAAQQAEVHNKEKVQKIHDDFKGTNRSADQQLKRALADAGEQRVACRMKNDEKAVRVGGISEQRHRAGLERLQHEYQDGLLHLQRAGEVRRQALLQSSQAREKALTDEYEERWRSLEAEWKANIVPLYQAIDSARTLADKVFPPWQTAVLSDWTPPQHFEQAAKFAQLEVDLEPFCGGLPKDRRLTVPGPTRFNVPLTLTFPAQGSVLFETATSGHDAVIGALNNIILRLLSVAPPGRLNFTIIDPVGLGQNFAGVMHLADYEEQIINSRIWTQSTQIEQKLGALNEHMEKVIQMYLRNEYQTIAEYNEQAGVIAEKYHFLVVADFPANFTDVAAKRLLSIAASGARCGVYTLIHWDQRQPLPQDFIPDELRKSSVTIAAKGSQFLLGGKPMPGTQLLLDVPPTPEMATEFIQEIGQKSRDSSRVEVPFSHVAPAPEEVWTEETTSELRVAIGRTGATKLQYLAIGKGTCQHGLIAGKTGSGKSTLFHVIITNLALWCSPEQVEFYLVDFKKGVEFKCYGTARLPHARVVAIESDREFGLSVLQRLDDELRRRGDLFRKLGVQDLPGYKRAGGTEAIPRTLLLVDEFQEFFVEDDTISQTASLLLDRLVRQGRAFGIHVLLGSQTLGGAYTVARTTLGQMVIRIALQCNEADAYLIMDDTNPAPRLLSRPGEGIYNDTAGTVEGNSPFQTVWLPDQVREAALNQVRARADENGANYPGPIVFEGNAPADVRENLILRDLLATPPTQPPAAARIWLGAPNSIKGPTEVVFHRQSGNNLLIVGQREEAILALVSVALISLAAQYPAGAARIILGDASAPGTPQRQYLERLLQTIPYPITLAKPGDLPEILNELSAEMKARADQPEAETAPPVFLLLHGLQKFARLRYEEEFSFSTPDAEAGPNPSVLLNNMISEGTRLGFHVLAACDTYNNVNRFISRKAFSEFEMRVLFQMSANDSASLIDSPKAGNLGLHRALFFNAQEGYLETFRPYALPPNEWIEQAVRNMSGALK